MDVHPIRVIEDLHHLRLSTDGADRKSADDLGERGQVRVDSGFVQRAVVAEPEAEHLVGDVEYAKRACQRAHVREEVRRGLYEPAGRGHWIDDDGGELPAVVLDETGARL